MANLQRITEAAIAKYRWRKRPHIPQTTVLSNTPTFYFLAPDFDKPSGGVRLLYRHVDHLNAAGYSAAVLTQRRGFRHTWFSSTTRVADIHTTAVAPNDILVVPELDVDMVATLPTPVQHIVLNQNTFLMWRYRPAELIKHYQGGAGLLGAITVSEQNSDMLRFAFPALEVQRVRGAVDTEIFHNLGPDGTPTSRDNVISYLPRRGRADAEQVIHLLRARGTLDGWQLREIDGLPQDDFARALRSSKIVISMSAYEGFGLPPAEAMACGAYVIGYHGFGGQEFFRPEFSHAVETGDILATARGVAAAVEAESTDLQWCAERGQAASEFVRRTYSAEAESRDVLDSYPRLAKLSRHD